MIRLAIPVIAVMLCAFEAKADPLKEERYVTEIKRDAKGQILRRADVLVAFKKIHPCPSTGQSTGACPNWQMNHVVPLACGGIDAVGNLAWLPTAIKACKGTICVDRYERKVYQANYTIAGTDTCKNEIVSGL
jgi:5-methylcytosine-specific restriction endonuclease McrA